MTPQPTEKKDTRPPLIGKEAARKLGLTERQLYEWIEVGILKGAKVRGRWYVCPAEVEQVLRRIREGEFTA